MDNELAIIKASSETAKNFSDIMKNFLQPDSIDLAIAEGHKELIKNVVDGKSVNPEVVNFLCGYKKYVKQQKRCKAIAEKAKDFIENSARPEDIKEDWLEFFFDKARLICDDNMQLIWAKLLAEEANNPGSINPSLLHTMSIIRYEQAQFFCNISRFALREFKKNDAHLLLFVSTNRKAYANSKITPSKLKDLERLGLIECEFEKEHIFEKKKILATGNKVLTIYGDPKYDNKIKAGNVNFTYDGQRLYSIIDHNYKKYRSDILEFIIAKLKIRNCTVIVNESKIF